MAHFNFVISQNAKWGHASFYIDCHRMTVPENILLQKKHWCGGMFKYKFVANLPESLPVKEFWKSINIWLSYGQEFSVLFFDSRCNAEFVIEFKNLYASFVVRRHHDAGRSGSSYDLCECLPLN